MGINSVEGQKPFYIMEMLKRYIRKLPESMFIDHLTGTSLGSSAYIQVPISMDRYGTATCCNHFLFISQSQQTTAQAAFWVLGLLPHPIWSTVGSQSYSWRCTKFFPVSKTSLNGETRNITKQTNKKCWAKLTTEPKFRPPDSHQH